VSLAAVPQDHGIKGENATKCERCSGTATLQLTEIEDGVPRALWFCSQHAREYAKESGLQLGEHFFDGWTVIPVTVAQSQIEAEETVTVDLPDGHTKRLKLSRHWHNGLCIAEVRHGAAGMGKPLYQFNIRVVA